jgi:23S rRNA pseudouridine1911/1915/1917 synthase
MAIKTYGKHLCHFEFTRRRIPLLGRMTSSRLWEVGSGCFLWVLFGEPVISIRVETLFQVLYEDAELLVINKPAGLVCHPTKTDAYSSLISRVRLYLGPEAQPQLVNRLDRETGGVTIVAKEAKAARELRRLWENRQVEKEYLALVHGHVSEAHGVIDAPLGKDEQSRVAIKDCVRPDGAPAITEYWVMDRGVRKSEVRSPKSEVKTGNEEVKLLFPGSYFGLRTSHFEPVPWTLLRVHPRNGRKHQIRIHLAHLGYPILGDKLYGGDEDLYLALVEDRLTQEQWSKLLLPFHALHARQVRFEWRGRETFFSAEPEPWFQDWMKSPIQG